MPALALRIEAPPAYKGVVAYAMELCRKWHIPRVDVDDVVQKVLTEIHASLPSFQSEKGDFVPWTRGITWKVIRRYQQEAQQYAKLFSEYPPNIEEHPTPDPSPQRHVEREQANCLISHAAQKVSAQQMNVFVLHAVDGMSHVEIGEELKIPKWRSQKSFQRTRDHLARCLHGKVL